ncbi:heavy-metal-associated domain-containing protein [Argonema antarcticum]|uniref:heavy-metal-associated domain-containing protein n=1 Tax=Argonema antarcticum TaxID=2942763 RepID=UPI00201219EF|nr:heavy-metal-associated domain-containing protein [Argonema antarcticum]MCL1475089.1 heavy-metal-associated domain-containing protein [Argonema antarcticum A004/B2]
MTLQLKVPNMACSACSETITKAIKTVGAIGNNFYALMQRLYRGLYKRSHHIAFVNSD